MQGSSACIIIACCANRKVVAEEIAAFLESPLDIDAMVQQVDGKFVSQPHEVGATDTFAGPKHFAARLLLLPRCDASAPVET